MKRLLTIVLLVLVVGAVVIFLFVRSGIRARASARQDASLLCLDMTNLPAGRFAVFSLTNGTGHHIVCIPEAFEQAKTNTWVRTSLTGRGSLQVRNWVGVREELEPGESFTFMVPPPITNGTWRLVFMCQERALVVDSVTDTARQLTDSKSRNNNLRQFSGRRYYITSSSVSNH